MWAIKKPLLLNILTSVLCQLEACAIIWRQAVDEPYPTYACGQFVQGHCLENIQLFASVRYSLLGIFFMDI